MTERHKAIEEGIDAATLFREAERRFAGQYRIERLVAATSNRALFLVRDEILKRTVALRVHLNPDTRSRDWFEREIETIARFDHRCLRTIHHAGRIEDWSFRTGQWVAGESLEEAVSRGPRPLPQVLRLATDLAELLEHVHSEDFVIRRIVPTSVMLDRTGRAIVTDLRFCNDCLDVANNEEGDEVLPFLAPEVRGHRPGDPTSDIYTAAAIVYYAATGQPPAVNPEDIVPAGELRASYPEAISRILSKALNPDPARRHFSGSALAGDLALTLGDFDFRSPVASNPEASLDRPAELERRLRRALGDDYELLGELGHGGFGRVYRVRDLMLEREVALKVLHPHLTIDHSVVERFHREARLAAQLGHPNIVDIYDIGGRAGLHWYTMAYIIGANLAASVERAGPQPVDLVLRMLDESLSALSHAHSRGIVHRDLKPENLLLSKLDGSVRIADFGLAVALEGTTAMGGVSSRSGTPEFAAPEQLLGEPVDERTDLYSLSLSAIFALIGKPPYSGNTVEAILAQHTSGRLPSIRTSRPDVPKALSDILTRGAEEDPEHRFESADEFKDELTRAFRRTAIHSKNWIQKILGDRSAID